MVPLPTRPGDVHLTLDDEDVVDINAGIAADFTKSNPGDAGWHPSRSLWPFESSGCSRTVSDFSTACVDVFGNAIYSTSMSLYTVCRHDVAMTTRYIPERALCHSL